MKKQQPTHFILYLVFVILLFPSSVVQATNYTFPGNLPPSCGGSNGNYSCGALSLGSGDSINLSVPLPATITVNGNMSLNITPINAAGTAANLNLIVTGTLSLTNASSPLKINANVNAGSINDQSGYLAFGGSLSTTTGSITLGYTSNVAGAITSTSGAITTGQGGVVGGAISSTSGNISIGYGANVGSVTTGGTISFAQSSIASGCANSSTSAGISLGYQAVVNSVCCGSSCNTGCVTNNSSYAMPAQCTIPTTATPSSFNAFDTLTTANATTGYMQTKIAGTAFTFDVVALTSTPSVFTSFVSTVKVELVDSSTSSTCSAMTLIQTVSSNYTFVGSENGRHTFSGVKVMQAYANAKVRISYPSTASSKVACSTDAFAIRPSYFGVVATDSSWSTAGTGRSLTASASSGTPIHKAGQPLTLTVTPYNSSGVVTTQYGSNPVVTVSCTLPTINCIPGVFSAGSFSVSGGVATSNTASYSDVGAVSVTVSDVNFTTVDANDGSTLSQRTISSTANTVGRFVPDHFDVTLNTPLFAPSCTTFTYMGQPIKYAINPVATITAKNAAGTTTQNYTSASGLFKISPSNAIYGITPSYAEASQSVTVLNSAIPVVLDQGSGISKLTFADTSSDILAITRPTSPINAFGANIALSFTLQDTDGVVVSKVNGTLVGNPVNYGSASSGNGISFTGGYNTQRWGRLSLGNVNGSELLPLTVPLFTEYYSGDFTTNTSDNCTSIDLGDQITLNNPSTSNGSSQVGTATMLVGSGTSIASLLNTTMISGVSGIKFSSPGVGNTGYINVIGSISSTLPWLMYPWNQGASNNPAALVTFGVYQGDPYIIYFREVY